MKKWIFINYCFQYIGLWNKHDMLNGVIHVFRIQMFNLVVPFLAIPYVYFGGRAGWPTILIIGASYLISSKIVVELIKNNINIEEMASLYDKTSRVEKILNFIFGLLISIMCILFLIFSFRILNYL